MEAVLDFIEDAEGLVRERKRLAHVRREARPDPRELDQVFNPERRPAGQRMSGGAEEDERGGPDRQHVEVGVGLNLPNISQPEIDGSVDYLGMDSGVVGDPKLDHKIRMAFGQRPDGALGRNVSRIGAHAKAQFADVEPFGERDLAHELAQFRCGPLAVPQHDLAERGRRDALPVEQRDAEIGLELLQAAGQRRLRDPKRLCGETEMMVLRQGLNHFDLSD